MRAASRSPQPSENSSKKRGYDLDEKVRGLHAELHGIHQWSTGQPATCARGAAACRCSRSCSPQT